MQEREKEKIGYTFFLRFRGERLRLLQEESKRGHRERAYDKEAR